MKKTIATLVAAAITALLAITASAQTKTIVSGTVLDSLTRMGEPAAILQFFDKKDLDKPVAFTTTDLDGAFSQLLTIPGEYRLLFSNLGRKETYRDFSLTDQDKIDLGIILVEDDMETLSAGTIVAQRPLVKMEVDKMTYDVENDVDSKSNTVLDMLRKVPMVTVDGSDNITVNGSSSFQVLVDGKPNVMLSSNPSQVFKSMPASAVKNIEVITNPGVKYDAEGVGGVLNITMAKSASGSSANLDGYNATVGLMATTRGIGERAFVTAQKGKFSFSANLNNMNMKIKGSETDMTRDQLDAAGGVASSMNSTSKLTLKTPATMASFSAGYEIDSLRLLSASFGYMSFASKSYGDMATTMNYGDTSFGYAGRTESVWDMGSITGGLDYQRSFANAPGRTLTLSYQFASSPSDTDSKSLFDNAPGSLFDLTDRYTDGGTNTIENTLQLDFTSPLATGLTFNAGAKYINRLNKSDQSFYTGGEGNWSYSESGSMKYRHNNNIAAGYAELSLSRDKWGAKAGARYEHTFVDVKYLLGNGSDFSLDYGNLVPSASIQYNIAPTRNIGLSYNMRISRPGITYLNPYVDTSDPTARSYGNTGLDTEKAHNVSLVYNFYSPKVMVNATLRHTYTGNAIGSYSFYDADGLLNTTYGNTSRSNVTGLSTFFNWSPTGKTRIMANASVEYTDLSSKTLGLSNSGWSANIFGGFQQTLPKDFRLSANIMYSTRSYSLEGWSDGLSMLMGGLTKTFFDDRVSVGINGVMPVGGGFKLNRKSYSEGSDYRSTTKTTVPMAQAILNISYTFGKNNRNATVKRSRKTISNDDVMDMSNGAEEMTSYTNM